MHTISRNAVIVLVSLVMPAAAEAQAGVCLPISGGISVTVVNNSPLTVLGNVTGTLEGTTQAVVQSQVVRPDGTIQLSVTHDFVTMDRSSLKTEDVVVWTPVPGQDGVFHMQTTYTIVGGTGRFAEARGSFHNHGEVDANGGLVALTYGGGICGVT